MSLPHKTQRRSEGRCVELRERQLFEPLCSKRSTIADLHTVRYNRQSIERAEPVVVVAAVQQLSRCGDEGGRFKELLSWMTKFRHFSVFLVSNTDHGRCERPEVVKERCDNWCLRKSVSTANGNTSLSVVSNSCCFECHPCSGIFAFQLPTERSAHSDCHGAKALGTR